MVCINLADGNTVWFNPSAILAVGPRIDDGKPIVGMSIVHTAIGVFIAVGSAESVAERIQEATHVVAHS